MKIFFHKKFQKFVKKVKDQKLIGIIKEEVDKVIAEPSVGKVLEHPFRKYRIQSVSFNYEKNSFRIAYTLKEDLLLFLLIDSRENFYDKLKRVV